MRVTRTKNTLAPVVIRKQQVPTWFLPVQIPRNVKRRTWMPLRRDNSTVNVTRPASKSRPDSTKIQFNLPQIKLTVTWITPPNYQVMFGAAGNKSAKSIMIEVECWWLLGHCMKCWIIIMLKHALCLNRSTEYDMLISSNTWPDATLWVSCHASVTSVNTVPGILNSAVNAV